MNDDDLGVDCPTSNKSASIVTLNDLQAHWIDFPRGLLREKSSNFNYNIFAKGTSISTGKLGDSGTKILTRLFISSRERKSRPTHDHHCVEYISPSLPPGEGYNPRTWSFKIGDF